MPGLPVLILSMHVERLHARELLADQAGGVGYLLKDRVFTDEQFTDALRTVARGGMIMDPEVGGADNPEAGGPEDPIERGGEAGVPVMQHELHPSSRLLQVHQEVPGLLGDPGFDRVPGGAEDPDAARAR